MAAFMTMMVTMAVTGAQRRSAAVACMAVLTLCAGCQSIQEVLRDAEKPGARLQDVQIAALDMDGADLSFDIEISNPYGVALPLTDLRYALSSRGRGIVAGDAPLSGSIPARGARTISVPASIQFRDLLDALRDVRPGAVVPYEAALDLVVDVPSIAGVESGELAIPLRHEDQLPIPALPEVSIERIDIEEFSLMEAALTLRLRVGNTNQFPLDLRTLSYGLSLAGAEVGSATVAEALSLQPGEDGTLEIPLRLSPASLGAAALDVLRGSRADYRIHGGLEVESPFGPITFPFDQTGEARLMR